jgi:hypothetical protein
MGWGLRTHEPGGTIPRLAGRVDSIFTGISTPGKTAGKTTFSVAFAGSDL